MKGIIFLLQRLCRNFTLGFAIKICVYNIDVYVYKRRSTDSLVSATASSWWEICARVQIWEHTLLQRIQVGMVYYLRTGNREKWKADWLYSSQDSNVSFCFSDPNM